MRKMVRLFRLFAFVLLTMVVTGSLAQGYREGELIVKFRSERAQTRGMAGVEGIVHVEAQRLMPLTGNRNAVTRSAKQSLVPAFSAPTADIDLSQLYLIRFDATSMTVEEAVKAYQAMDGVEYAEPNYLLEQISTSDDVTKYQAEPRYAEQWYMEAIRMPELWQQAITKEKRPVIAILDTGVDITHPDLKDNIASRSLLQFLYVSVGNHTAQTPEIHRKGCLQWMCHEYGYNSGRGGLHRQRSF